MIVKDLKKWLADIQQFLETKKLFGVQLNHLLYRVTLSLVLVLFIAWMLPTERPFEYSNLTVGSISQEEIIAPFTFPILKTPEQLAMERQKARLSVPPVFDFQKNIAEVQEIKLHNFFTELTGFFQKNSKNVKLNELSHEKPSAVVDSLLKQFSVKYNLSLGPEDIKVFYTLYRAKKLKKFEAEIQSGLKNIYQVGIINVSMASLPEQNITVKDNGVEEIRPKIKVLDPEQAAEAIDLHLEKVYAKDSKELNLAKKITAAFIIPNLVLNKELTEARKEKAVREVPPTSGFVYKNQRIVDSHEIITEDIHLKLQSLEKALKERSVMQHGWRQVLFHVGKYLVAIIIVFILGLFLYFYRPDLLNDNRMLLLITTILLLQFLAVVLVTRVLHWNSLSVPILLAPMLLSMLLDAPLAFWGTVVTSLVIGASLGNNYYLAFMTLIVGTIAIFSVRKIRNRGQMFRAILYITLGYLAVNFSYGFLHFESWKVMLQNFVFFLLPNAILGPTAVFLFIGVFERFFDVTTDITLLELSDLNHPLLKRLSVEAPGTFHHSIIVGNLAEAAAKAIGANSLLARVGCYYHDIGKMSKAEYFVENQADAMNKHEKLSPTMSSLILVKHVKAGLELAEKYKLPRAVKQFIPEHHGTSLMSFFYHKAKETMDPNDVQESDFRYPGPKPQSKETGIAMLADTVEAAARSLTNPTPQKIRALVEDLVDKKFREGELNECDISLRELNQIKEAFVPILLGIHHLRIEYPEDKPTEKAKKTSEHEKKTSNGAKVSAEGDKKSDKEKADEIKPVEPVGADDDKQKSET